MLLSKTPYNGKENDGASPSSQLNVVRTTSTAPLY